MDGGEFVKMKNNKVLVCNSCTDFLYDENTTIGGLNVQMYLWARTFHQHGWDVTCITHLKQLRNVEVAGIKHIYTKTHAHLEAFFVFVNYFIMLMRLRPSLILVRGRGVSLYPLSIFSKIIGSKLVFMVAADTNMDKGHEAKLNFETKLFRRAVPYVKYFVAQNTIQQNQLLQNYSKKSIIIPNIWGQFEGGNVRDIEKNDILWVGNIRKVKRVEWFLDLAERNPEYKFVVIGGALDEVMYEAAQHRAASLPNVDFVGKLGFLDTNRWFERAKLFVCTSISEGFPNTFLQAWSNDIPVLATVDPSDVVARNGLGEVGDDIDSINVGLHRILDSEETYNQYSDNVKKYFSNIHNADLNYEKLMNLIEENEE